jgi:hypothetical protein
MANENGVKIGNIKRMGGGTTPPPPVDELPPWSERETGLPGFLNTLGQNVTDSRLAEKERMESGYRFLAGIPQPTGYTPMFEYNRANSADLRGRAANQGTGSVTPLVDPVEDPFAAFLAQFADQGTGTGRAAPDYSQYRAALTDQAQQINAQIQAMYNALGDEASANVGRIQDIYGGASTGIGNVYDSAAANTADAYGSSQQQAADQLARLGIEAAAPAVVNPMALSQAEALSGLEAGKAGGQAAAERYGATAGGFGSQMAQVAQQQGTEMNAAVLNALQNRLNETLLMEEQGRQAAASGGGGADPMSSAMQYLKLQEMFNAPAMAQQELEFKAAQIAADNTLSERDKFIELALQFERDRNLNPLQAQEEAAIYLENVNRTLGIG